MTRFVDKTFIRQEQQIVFIKNIIETILKRLTQSIWKKATFFSKWFVIVGEYNSTIFCGKTWYQIKQEIAIQ